MALKLADYLGLTLSGARRDWRRIADRPPHLPGRRQENFTVAETLLCLAASLVVNHRQFGGSTSQAAPSPVPELASLFKRTNASVLAKMANLDGSRSHGARFEVEAAAHLLDHGAAALLASYSTVLEASRMEGFGPSVLPDFLELGSGGEFDLLGQHELSTLDIEQEVAKHLVLVSERHSIEESVTERLLVAVARVNQHVFARTVLANCGTRCVFCGLDPGPRLERRGLVRASHIKPWRASDSFERLDVRNGLAACPTHDQAFDTGLLSIDADLGIHLAPHVEERAGSNLEFRRAFGRPPIAASLLLPETAEAPRQEYLEWHRQNLAA